MSHPTAKPAARRLRVLQPDPFVERLWPEHELLQVGDLAKATGKTVRAIHLYESLGLIRPQNRSKGRYRLFSPDMVLRVRWISKLQSLGLSLTDIQALTQRQQSSASAQFAASQLRDVYTEKLRQTQKKLAELRALEEELLESLQYLHSCDTNCVPDLPTDSCVACDRHVDIDRAPELVAGAHVGAQLH